MLRYVLLFLAVGPVFSSDNGLLPLRFNTYYSVKIEVHDLLRQTRTSITQWYDELHQKSRIDVFGTTQQMVLQTPIRKDTWWRYPRWLLTTVYPLTTEQNGTIVNKKACVNTLYTGTDDSIPTFLPHLLEYSEMSFGIVRMEFPTRERMHNEDADKWKRRNWRGAWAYVEENHLFEDIWWTTYKEFDGVRRIVPLRLEKMIHNLKTGTKDSHIRFDYYEYDPSKFDIEVFNITKGLVCSPVGTEQAEEQDEEQAEDLAKWSSRHSDVFAKFKANHSREYASEEEHEMRLRVFKENLEMIEEHNGGQHSYKLAVNHLADRTLEEIAAMAGHPPSDTPNSGGSVVIERNYSKLPQGHPFPYSKEEIEKLSANLPKHMDWRALGAVSVAKDQSRCEASWAFAAVGAVESGLFLHRKRRSSLVQLSEQALIDCSWGYGNAGCRAGDVKHAFDWIAAYGIPNTAVYGGYLSLEDNCRLKDMEIETKIKGYVTVESDVKALKVAIFKHGPVAVRIGVTRKFPFYSSGVFSDPDCPNDQHALTQSALVVGYGVLDGQSYWLIKNSWGRSWGISGYVLIATDNNICGVLTDANFPFFE